MDKDQIKSTKNALHYTWGDHCDGWWLKQQGSFNVIEESMPPNSSEINHLHKYTEQFFYCLDGVLNINLDNTQYVLYQYDSLCIKAGIAHRVFNQSDKPVRFLVVSCPNLRDDRENFAYSKIK